MKEGLDTVPVSTCYLCGGPGQLLYAGLRDRLFGAPGMWNIRICRRCDLLWLDPRPTPAGSMEIYTQDYHTHRATPDADGPGHTLASAIKEYAVAASCGYAKPQLRGYASLAGRLASWFGPTREVASGSVGWLKSTDEGRLLDVGCGNGAFLARMRRLGWQVEGLDPDPLAVSAAVDEFQLAVECSTVEEAALPAGRFDAVMMHHVIEHLPDPVVTLEECGRVLRPGGWIVVVTPNTHSLARRWFGESWRGWEPPRHFFLFSVRALKECAERAGLQVREIRTTARRARFMWEACRMLRRMDGHPDGQRASWPVRLEGMLFWLAEHVAAVNRPRGEEILMIATKR